MAKPTKDALKRLNYKIGDVFGLNTRMLVRKALFGLPKEIDIVDAKNTFVTFAFAKLEGRASALRSGSHKTIY